MSLQCTTIEIFFGILFCKNDLKRKIYIFLIFKFHFSMSFLCKAIDTIFGICFCGNCLSYKNCTDSTFNFFKASFLCTNIEIIFRKVVIKTTFYRKHISFFSSFNFSCLICVNQLMRSSGLFREKTIFHRINIFFSFSPFVFFVFPVYYR